MSTGRSSFARQAGLALALGFAPSTALAGDRGTIALGAIVEPPAGYVALCSESPTVCAPNGHMRVVLDALDASLHLQTSGSAFGAIAALPAPADPGPQPLADADRPALALTSKKMVALLRRVNRKVNAGVLQRRDIDTVGQDDLWRPSGTGPGAAGDCEDIALEKRLRLLEHGVPAGQLSLAVVYSRAAGLHTVLVARTDAGDLVLDNRRGTVLPWQRTRYSWVAMQVAATPEWRAVL